MWNSGSFCIWESSFILPWANFLCLNLLFKCVKNAFLKKCFALLNNGHGISTEYYLNHHWYYTFFFLFVNVRPFFSNGIMCLNPVLLILSKFVELSCLWYGVISSQNVFYSCFFFPIDYRVKIRVLQSIRSILKYVFFNIFYRSKHWDSHYFPPLWNKIQWYQVTNILIFLHRWNSFGSVKYFDFRAILVICGFFFFSVKYCLIMCH